MTEDIGALIDNQLLKAVRVAKLLDISRSKAYAMMTAGELPTVLIGKGIRVPAKALAKWVESGTRVPPKARAA